MIQPTPYLYSLQNLVAYTNTQPIFIDYLKTLRTTFGVCPKLKIVGGQSESSTKNPQPSSANQNRVLGYSKMPESSKSSVEASSRLSAQVGLL